MQRMLNDQAMAERVLAHIAAGTTDLAEGVWREPVESYRSPARLAAELRVLRRLPVPFCPSAALPEIGSYVARDAAGTPIVAVRDGDGRVRAFRNACRHRGMQVAEGTGCAKAFVCRYHGWTYGLDGALRHVPHEEGFPGLERERHGLVPVEAVEVQGLVLVTQEPSQASRRALADIEALPELVSPGARLFAARETPVPANWKVFLEGLIEGYHIRTTHPTSFYPFGYDNLNVVEHLGPHSRVTYPFRRIRELESVPPAERRVAGALTYVYHLFPNAAVTMLSHHTVVLVLEPVSVDETRLVTWSLANRTARTAGAARPASDAAGTADADAAATADAARDAAFVNDTGAAEDYAVVCAIQRGMASGANEAFTFGRFEGAIAHFHRALAAALGAG